jgi:hypothetical protein
MAQVALLWGTAAWAGTVRVQDYKADLVRVPLEVGVENIKKLLFQGDRMFVLGWSEHEVVVGSGSDSTSLRRFGSIGNGKGEFYYPADLVIGPHGYLYVADSGNSRIQVLDPEGKLVSAFSDAPKSVGLAVDHEGLVYLGQPRTGSLVSVYGQDGRRVRSFGDLVLPSTVYGQGYLAKDEEYKIPMNRAWMTVDDDDNVWMAFLHYPLICKFSRDGRLLLKRTVDLSGLELLKKAVWQSPPPGGHASVKFDGIQITLITKDILFDPARKEIVVLLGDERILVLDKNGAPKYTLTPDTDIVLHRLAMRRGDLMTFEIFSRNVYRIVPSAAR